MSEYQIKDKNGEWVNGEPITGEVCRKVIPTEVDNAYEEFIYEPETDPDLTIIKAEKLLEIKNEAKRRIELLDWRLERAKERKELGLESDPDNELETVADVMRMREKIREASDVAENEMMEIETVEDVQAFSW